MSTTQKKTTRRRQATRAAIKAILNRNCDGITLVLAIGAALALTTCTVQPAHATMTPALKGAGARHTISEAVQTPTDKRRFVMPEYLEGRGVPTSSRHGYGQDAPTRKGGGTASDVCLTSCPPYALRQAAGGFLIVPEGA